MTSPPSVNYNFLFNAASLPSGAALTRASTGWYFDSSGVLQSATTDAARFTYDPSTLALQGLLNEPAATNSLRNASAGGAAAGTPGTAPTNWQVTSTANGITRQIVGTGTEAGIAYIDIKYSGTPSNSSTLSITTEANTQIAALSGQTWVSSFYVTLQAGSTTNVTSFKSGIQGRNSGGASVDSSTRVFVPVSAGLATQRFDDVHVMAVGTVAFVTNTIAIAYTLNNAIDFTLRVGLPQCVQAPAASSPIVTTSAAVTRAADVTTLTVSASTYNVDIVRTGQTASTRVIAADGSGGSYVAPTSVLPLKQVRAGA